MLNNIAGVLAPYVAIPTGDYESIQTVTVGAGGSTSIDFTSIPSTYKHLQIRSLQLSTTDFFMQFNGDTGNNYNAGHQVRGDGSSATAAALGQNTGMYFGFTGSGSAYGATVADILDYRNTSKYTTVRQLIGYDANGSGFVALRSNLWMNTAAITSIKIFPISSGTISQYSSFALYGIKG